MINPQHALVFGTPEYMYLAESVSKKIKTKLGQVEMKNFSDGERYMRIIDKVREQDVVLVGGTHNDTATLDLFDMACGLVTDGCRSLKIVIPFFGYSTMERAVKTGEVVTAKTRARLLSAIPIAPFGNQVVMMDLHSEGIPFYYEGAVKTHHLYAKSLVIEEARVRGGKNFILGAVDAGRAKWVESLANDLGVHAGFVYKRRTDDGKVSVTGVNVEIKGSNVVIYDDMIRSGGSILQAAQAYKAAGAHEIFLITTHGVFTSGSLEKLKSSGLISGVTCTDTHPHSQSLKESFLKVLSVSQIISDYLLGGPRDNH